jgi:hypothetical protein
MKLLSLNLETRPGRCRYFSLASISAASPCLTNATTSQMVTPNKDQKQSVASAALSLTIFNGKVCKQAFDR